MTSSLPAALELAHFGLAAQHPLTRAWQADETRLERLAEIYGFDLQLAHDLDLAAKRAEFLDVGQGAQAFLNRWVNVPPDLHAMLSIRFEGLDRAKPFVDASLLSRPLTELDLPALAEVAREIYGTFKPLYLRLWSAAPAGHFPETSPDKRFLAAPIVELRKVDVPPELNTRPTPDLQHYPDAQAAYASVDARHPDHPQQAQIESEETLQELIEVGTLFDVLVNGEWAGYVGSTENFAADTLGLDAYVVQELILAPPFRGKGYGTFLSTLLARALPDQSRVLIGIIHAENRGAITAATRAGRVDVGGWVQIRL
ncbi:GNAT family N-acetyltransferase [Deinococcus psychrotolerans]|uniref:GNAT family N-acetyltransferase n=1 Tax=Deinococcus psychrotolerans TaxID=2489213 RepID=A0A3G8YAD9_9DEIO|nr:GNAT family N-acetyltransferase [Deinococcus psychrotolerans]AZI42322.1 GNAT family N-acetyltransferase [Deinococcus psychrotolerans]